MWASLLLGALLLPRALIHADDQLTTSARYWNAVRSVEDACLGPLVADPAGAPYRYRAVPKSNPAALSLRRMDSALIAYSAGPDLVDDEGSGDDVLVLARDHPRLLALPRSRWCALGCVLASWLAVRACRLVSQHAGFVRLSVAGAGALSIAVPAALLASTVLAALAWADADVAGPFPLTAKRILPTVWAGAFLALSITQSRSRPSDVGGHMEATGVD